MGQWGILVVLYVYTYTIHAGKGSDHLNVHYTISIFESAKSKKNFSFTSFKKCIMLFIQSFTANPIFTTKKIQITFKNN